MSGNLSCPKLAELEAFAHGTTAAKDIARIQGHLARCSLCRNLHASLAAPETSTHANHPAGKIPKMTLSDDKPPPPSETYSFLLPPVNSDEIGRLGNYRVLHLLGQGGMGLVFLAEDLQLARPVALKVMRPEFGSDEEGFKRFLREARAMAAIKHDHLVTIYQAAQENGVIYFAMELLEGESLDAWIRRETNPDVRDIVRMAREIASGLAFIHQKNLIHRDIKPANIWLESSLDSPPTRSGVGRIKILDLGLVRAIKDEVGLTQTGIVMGTPEFMAPEQARGTNVDARADLFSLGGVLYYLCTRRKPFQGETSVAVLMALASETPPAVSELKPGLPGELSDLVMQLLSRNPDKRPATATEVLRRLEAIERELGGYRAVGPTPISSVPDTQVIMPMERPKKRKAAPVGILFWIGVFVCFAFVGVGVGTVLLILRGTIFPPPRPPVEPQPPQPIFGNVTYLSELQDIRRENWPFKPGPDGKGPKKKPKKDGPGKEGKDGKDGPPMDGNQVRHQGKDFLRGIFMHPPVPPNEGEPASLTYRLNKQFSTFQAEVSLHDGPERSETPCVFRVYGDGRMLWESREVSSQADRDKCNVSVKGVDELKISVQCAGPPRGAHAVWLDPNLSK